MSRGFRLQTLLTLRESLEESQKRRVQQANASLVKSATVAEEAKRWIERTVKEAMLTKEAIPQVEIAFVAECVATSRTALQHHAAEQKKLEEALRVEVSALQTAHQKTATVSTLRDHHLRAVAAEERRREQLSLDEAFRLLRSPRTGIEKAEISPH